jgi:hypothetical protein
MRPEAAKTVVAGYVILVMAVDGRLIRLLRSVGLAERSAQRLAEAGLQAWY